MSHIHIRLELTFWSYLLTLLNTYMHSPIPELIHVAASTIPRAAYGDLSIPEHYF